MSRESIDPAREYTVDLLVMPVVDEKPNPQAVRSIEKFVVASAGRVVDRALEPTFSALRVRLRGQALNQTRRCTRTTRPSRTPRRLGPSPR